MQKRAELGDKVLLGRVRFDWENWRSFCKITKSSVKQTSGWNIWFETWKITSWNNNYDKVDRILTQSLLISRERGVRKLRRSFKEEEGEYCCHIAHWNVKFICTELRLRFLRLSTIRKSTHLLRSDHRELRNIQIKFMWVVGGGGMRRLPWHSDLDSVTFSYISLKLYRS